MTITIDASRIRALNDDLRCHGRGGRFNITQGVAALPPAVQHAALVQVRRFKAFDPDNDPHQEHDFGAFAIGDARLFFKIDYYDRSCRIHSPDPADPDVTCRVLTLMLAEEY